MGAGLQLPRSVLHEHRSLLFKRLCSLSSHFPHRDLAHSKYQRNLILYIHVIQLETRCLTFPWLHMWLNVWPGVNKSDADLNIFLLLYIGRWGNTLNKTSVKVIVTDSPYNLTTLAIGGAWKVITVAVWLEEEDSLVSGPYPGQSTQRGWRKLMSELGSLIDSFGLDRGISIGGGGKAGGCKDVSSYIHRHLKWKHESGTEWGPQSLGHVPELGMWNPEICLMVSV